MLELIPYGRMLCITLMQGQWVWSCPDLICQTLLTPMEALTHREEEMNVGWKGGRRGKEDWWENCGLNVKESKKTRVIGLVG